MTKARKPATNHPWRQYPPKGDPTPRDAERIIRLRKMSRRGERLSREESDECRRAFLAYPKWYESTEHRVFVETAPFGSAV